MFRILFICTGSSGRSQMAAAIARRFAPPNAEIACAGDSNQPVNLLSVQVMKESGESIPEQTEHTLDDISAEQYDVVITLCNKAREICPTFPGSPARIHWPLINPERKSDDQGTDQVEAFRQVRDEIHRRVEGLFEHGFLDSILQVRLTFASLLENLTDGVMAHDLDRQIYYFNEAAQRITGYNYKEIIGRDCHDAFPGRFCGGDCSFCEDGAETHSRIRYPQTFNHRDGTKRDLEMSVVTVNTTNGDVTGALVIFRDITEIVHVRQKLVESRGFHGIIGHHFHMQKVFDSIGELAEVNVPILIQGESGTGKEMVATALHQLSSRSSGPFVPVNCGALPEGTLESELFGHVKGAFTGAIRNKKGRFELAEGGTIFLDEIGEISPKMQVRLLRVLQEKAFIPVGGEKLINADVRIICATNKDLKHLTKQGIFREDLYYRLAVIPLQLPSLRDRASDIPILTDHFMDKFSTDTGIQPKEITPHALNVLTSYKWPGNVRELRNAIQYAMIKSQGGVIEVQHLPDELVTDRDAKVRFGPGRPAKIDHKSVEAALEKTGGNKAKAARLLGISRTSLYRYLPE
ncbi:sigma-54-dependent Fis family transcriptional regulator [candidate division LCP-89 bacterium B3_LCP]|uniref:Sigma-54-dependent Fis family transcriptional regulator n=1 Tax=candidate division LCP-89 bacterium B3_LCP TaxID=2012998 RepID=A0A532UR51_UNCL8|nr:MAG: sigma-54-dependent Fis family transcriptional regulator [candidate division LCP-89 bacterium B3_LCP]